MSDAELVELYQPRIKELAALVRVDHRLIAPDCMAEARGPVCGSRVLVELGLGGRAAASGTKVAQVGWRVRGCILSSASMAIFSSAAVGQSLEEITYAGDKLAELLTGQDPQFGGPWTDLRLFCAARQFPERHGSVLLPWHACNKAVELNCGDGTVSP